MQIIKLNNNSHFSRKRRPRIDLCRLKCSSGGPGYWSSLSQFSWLYFPDLSYRPRFLGMLLRKMELPVIDFWSPCGQKVPFYSPYSSNDPKLSCGAPDSTLALATYFAPPYRNLWNRHIEGQFVRFRSFWYQMIPISQFVYFYKSISSGHLLMSSCPIFKGS